MSIFALTINHTITQKEAWCSIAHSKRRRRMEPLSRCRMHHAKRVHRYKQREQKNHYKSTCHILFSCLLYQLEFPTLLAMREIIANAFFNKIVRIFPRTWYKGTISFWKSKSFCRKVGWKSFMHMNGVNHTYHRIQSYVSFKRIIRMIKANHTYHRS